MITAQLSPSYCACEKLHAVKQYHGRFMWSLGFKNENYPHAFTKCEIFFICLSCRDVVLKLLQFEASTNVSDSKGCFPLHLAAWRGDVDIVQILIHHGPSHSRVNEQVHTCTWLKQINTFVSLKCIQSLAGKIYKLNMHECQRVIIMDGLSVRNLVRHN